MMEFSNAIQDYQKSGDASDVLSEAIETFILLLAPIAPHCADELWSSLGYEGFTAEQDWPVADPALLQRDVVTIALQVNGKLRGTLDAPADISREELEKQALAHEKVQQFVQGLVIRKVIVVPGKLINVVAS